MPSVVTRTVGLALILSALTSALAQAQLSSALTKRWVLDARASEPLMGSHPDMSGQESSEDAAVTIRLSSAGVAVDHEAGQRTVSRQYAVTASMAALDAIPAGAVLTDQRLVVHRQEMVQLPLGQVMVDTTETYTLQKDGSLILRRTTTTPHGTLTRSLVFRQSASKAGQ